MSRPDVAAQHFAQAAPGCGWLSRPLRLFPILALLAAPLFQTVPLSAAPLDPKSLVLSAADLGPHWVLSSESTDGSSDELKAYAATFANGADYLPSQRGAVIGVIVGPD